jgi:MFS family permease
MEVLNAVALSRRPATAFVAVGLFWGCFAAYIPDLKIRLNVSDATFGLLLLCNALGLVSSMWLAPKIDLILGTRGLQIGTAVFAITFFLPGFAPDAFTFGLSMAVVGAASGLADVLMNARVSELEQIHKRPLMNANHGMFSLGYAAAAFGSGFGREAEVEPGVAFLAIGCVIIVMSTFLNIKISNRSLAGPELFSYPIWPILICGLVVLLAFMIEATVETWSAIHIERTLQGRAAEGALGPAMLGITMALGRFFGQSVSQTFSETRVIIFATLVTAFGAILAALALTPVWAYVGFGILGLGVSVIGPSGLALVGKYVPSHLRTEAISRVAVLGFAGFFLAPALMGLVSEFYGLRFAFLSAAFLSLIIFPLMLILRRSIRV